jgi:hypothetical protein
MVPWGRFVSRTVERPIGVRHSARVGWLAVECCSATRLRGTSRRVHGSTAPPAVLSWYSIIHTPPQDVPAVLNEFARCIRPRITASRVLRR